MTGVGPKIQDWGFQRSLYRHPPPVLARTVTYLPVDKYGLVNLKAHGLRSVQGLRDIKHTEKP